ncbi:MAG TPA: thioredoxin [Candidatus Nanoarchaeia archaeon]|nr:thioredoxin [Candidatus Nanoarchaeia archaeon]
MANDKVPDVSNAEFEKFVSKGVVLIDFFAEWCMPCMMMTPIIEELSDKFKGKIKFGKVNVGESQELAQKHNVSSIPNFVLFKNGKVVEQFVGSMSEDDLEEKLGNYI